mmetsp:Transcript_109978/g.350216  ORF Transcript_109978/g.350216 Transcript_109978/m.350216 type:complete len:459 (+) Transcript_109978:437-1813(+)
MGHRIHLRTQHHQPIQGFGLAVEGRKVHGRPAVPVRGLHIGAVLLKDLEDVVVAHVCRAHEGREARSIGEVDIRAVLEGFLERVHFAYLGGAEEVAVRCGFEPLLPEEAHTPLPGIVLAFGRIVDQVLADQVDGIPLELRDRLQVRAQLDQLFQALGLAGGRGEVHGGPLILVNALQIGCQLLQHCDALRLALLRSETQGRARTDIAEVDRGSARHSRPQLSDVPGARGLVHLALVRAAEALRLQDVHELNQQLGVRRVLRLLQIGLLFLEDVQGIPLVDGQGRKVRSQLDERPETHFSLVRAGEVDGRPAVLVAKIQLGAVLREDPQGWGHACPGSIHHRAEPCRQAWLHAVVEHIHRSTVSKGNRDVVHLALDGTLPKQFLGGPVERWHFGRYTQERLQALALLGIEVRDEAGEVLRLHRLQLLIDLLGLNTGPTSHTSVAKWEECGRSPREASAT